MLKAGTASARILTKAVTSAPSPTARMTARRNGSSGSGALPACPPPVWSCSDMISTPHPETKELEQVKVSRGLKVKLHSIPFLNCVENCNVGRDRQVLTAALAETKLDLFESDRDGVGPPLSRVAAGRGI